MDSTQINSRAFKRQSRKLKFIKKLIKLFQEVDLPLVEQSNCQNMLRATRLGTNFMLDTQRFQIFKFNSKFARIIFSSFICAGGESGKDACTGKFLYEIKPQINTQCLGDGGSPLVCFIANQWYVAGLVAWGIGCGNTNVPGVYVNVANYVNWIQQTTRSG